MSSMRHCPYLSKEVRCRLVRYHRASSFITCLRKSTAVCVTTNSHEAVLDGQMVCTIDLTQTLDHMKNMTKEWGIGIGRRCEQLVQSRIMLLQHDTRLRCRRNKNASI